MPRMNASQAGSAIFGWRISLGRRLATLKLLKSAALSIARAATQHEPPILPILHVQNDKALRLEPRPRFR